MGPEQDLAVAVGGLIKRYERLTGFENLCFRAALYGMQKTSREARGSDLLETFGLVEAASRKFGGYSKGDEAQAHHCRRDYPPTFHSVSRRAYDRH